MYLLNERSHSARSLYHHHHHHHPHHHNRYSPTATDPPAYSSAPSAHVSSSGNELPTGHIGNQETLFRTASLPNGATACFNPDKNTPLIRKHQASHSPQSQHPYSRQSNASTLSSTFPQDSEKLHPTFKPSGIRIGDLLNPVTDAPSPGGSAPPIPLTTTPSLYPTPLHPTPHPSKLSLVDTSCRDPCLPSASPYSSFAPSASPSFLASSKPTCLEASGGPKSDPPCLAGVNAPKLEVSEAITPSIALSSIPEHRSVCPILDFAEEREQELEHLYDMTCTIIRSMWPTHSISTNNTQLCPLRMFVSEAHRKSHLGSIILKAALYYLLRVRKPLEARRAIKYQMYQRRLQQQQQQQHCYPRTWPRPELSPPSLSATSSPPLSSSSSGATPVSPHPPTVVGSVAATNVVHSGSADYNQNAVSRALSVACSLGTTHSTIHRRGGSICASLITPTTVTSHTPLPAATAEEVVEGLKTEKPGTRCRLENYIDDDAGAMEQSQRQPHALRRSVSDSDARMGRQKADVTMCGRRMYIAALMVASKYLLDRPYSNRAWTKITHLSIGEIGEIERAFLALLNGHLHICAKAFGRWEEMLPHITIKGQRLVVNPFQRSQDQVTERGAGLVQGLSPLPSTANTKPDAAATATTTKRQTPILIPATVSEQQPSLPSSIPPSSSQRLQGEEEEEEGQQQQQQQTPPRSGLPTPSTSPNYSP